MRLRTGNNEGTTVNYEAADLLTGTLHASNPTAAVADMIEVGAAKGCLEVRQGPELRWSAALDAMGSKLLSQASMAALVSAATFALEDPALAGQRRATIELILEAAKDALPSAPPADLL